MVTETAEFMGRLEGYELRRAELEKELSWERLLHKETRRQLEAAEQARDEAAVSAEDGAAARRQLATARERIEELERRLEQQDELLANVRASVDRGAARLAGLEERLVELRESERGAPLPEREVLEQAWDTADRGTERLAALERRLTELRTEI
jgi:chromosome segregation ATPase